MLFVKILLAASPLLLIAASFLPKVIIQRVDRSRTAQAIEDFHDLRADQADRELTFEEQWDAADDEFMRRWSSFCSRDLETENSALVLRFAEEAEEVIQRTANEMRWAYDQMACHFIRVATPVELHAEYMVLKANGDFDVVRDYSDYTTDTMIWTPEMEAELAAMLADGAREEVKVCLTRSAV